MTGKSSETSRTDQSRSGESTWQSRLGPSLALTIIAAGSLLSALDLFVVNLAFSSIRDSFPGVSNQALSWVLSAYSIVFAALLVPAGRLADRFGRRRLFRIGLLLFALASGGCALAPDVLTLIVARSLKGFGAALMVPTSLGLLLAAYPADQHKKMVGIWAAIGSIGAALGPVLGGVLVTVDWRLIFLINLPIAFPAVWLARYLHETETKDTAIPDMLGSLAFALGIAFLVAAISYASDWGVESYKFAGSTTAGLILLAAFVWRCLTCEVPALDLRIFQIPTFSLSVVGMLCFYIAFSMTILSGTLYLTQVWHWDAMKAGLGFICGPASAGAAAIAAGRAHLAPRTLTLIGSACFVCANAWWYVMMSGNPNYFGAFMPGLLLSGIATGLAQTGFIAGGSSAIAASDYATGTGVLNTARQVGGAVGVAILVAATGDATVPADFEPVYLIAGASIVAAAISALALRGGQKRAIA